jgi:hypothetical protein
MNLDPGESAVFQVPRPETVDWPVLLTVRWEGRGGDVVPTDDGDVRWTRVPVPMWRRIWFWTTGRYEYTYEGWPT